VTGTYSCGIEIWVPQKVRNFLTSLGTISFSAAPWRMAFNSWLG